MIYTFNFTLYCYVHLLTDTQNILISEGYYNIIVLYLVLHTTTYCKLIIYLISWSCFNIMGKII